MQIVIILTFNLNLFGAIQAIIIVVMLCLNHIHEHLDDISRTKSTAFIDAYIVGTDREQIEKYLK